MKKVTVKNVHYTILSTAFVINSALVVIGASLKG